MRHEWKLLLVFCGIPGAGKSTLARKLQQEAKIVGHSAHIVEFDTFYNDYNDNNFDPVEWKKSRNAALESVQSSLANNNIDVVIVDDTMHYKSMRAQCWKLGRLFGTSYCQVFVDSSFSVCVERNSKRPKESLVPKHSLNKIFEIFEPPNLDEGHPWDRDTVVVTTVGDEISPIWEQVEAFWWKGPLPPMRTSEELDPMIHKLTVETFTHQVDLQSRAIVHECLSSFSGEFSKKKEIAVKLASKRKEVLKMAKKSFEESPEQYLQEFKEYCASIAIS